MLVSRFPIVFVYFLLFQIIGTLCAPSDVTTLPPNSAISVPTIGNKNDGPIVESNTSANMVESNTTELSLAAIDQLVEMIDENNVSSANSTTSTTSTTTETYSPPSYDVKCKSPSEVYSNCTNSCPASCEDPNRKACRNFCWNGCECAPGYVKNHRWHCIPRENCPKCGPNEHYRNCGSNCEPTCDSYQNLPVYCNNRASCKRGCFCDYGFVRDMSQNGSCVPIEKCPQKCGPNEYWDISGEPCVRTVEDPRPKCLFEPPSPGCVCNTGFKRNPANNECVPISVHTVIQNQCSQNETFSFCGSDCAMNCFDENKRKMCPTICHRGCFCNEGYRRDSSGRCVLPDDCRTWTNSYETAVLFS